NFRSWVNSLKAKHFAENPGQESSLLLPLESARTTIYGRSENSCLESTSAQVSTEHAMGGANASSGHILQQNCVRNFFWKSRGEVLTAPICCGKLASVSGTNVWIRSDFIAP